MSKTSATNRGSDSPPRLGFISAKPKEDADWLRIALDILAPRIGVAFHLFSTPQAAFREQDEGATRATILYGSAPGGSLEKKAGDRLLIRMVRANSNDPRRAVIDDRRVERCEPENGAICYFARSGVNAIFEIAGDPPGLKIHADLARMAWFLASRREELEIPMRDDHDRVPSSFTYQVEQGDIERPLIDEAALDFADALRSIDIEPRPARPWLKGDSEAGAGMAICSTYDIDSLRKFPSGTALERLRSLGGVIKREALKMPLRLAGQILRKSLGMGDPHLHALEIVRVDARRERKPTVYVIDERRDRLDPRYAIDDLELLALHRDVTDQGGEFGLHPGYGVGRDGPLLSESRSAFQAAYGDFPRSVRLHYLRWEPHRTPRAFAESGVAVDSTLGWPDRAGFRCGTALPIPLIHPLRDETLRAVDDTEGAPSADATPIIEVPMIVMDTTLALHQNLEIREAERLLEDLGKRTARVGGVFTVLQHPHVAADPVNGEWSDWSGVLEKIHQAENARWLTVGEAADLWREAAAPYRTILEED